MDTRAQVSNPVWGGLSFLAWVLLLPLGGYIGFETGDWSVFGMWCGLTALMLLFNVVTRREEQTQASDGQQAKLTDYGGGK